ncbi:metallophosphoesterase family protein [Candidatus Woesearchaeota archaeon]|nr:metallophosphoesterase family protein [Candidatus Woesearchaeota archaeon]
MIILAFSDTHLNEQCIKEIIKNAKKADILICAGDISWFGTGLKKVLQEIDKNTTKPLYIIPGNHEEGPDLENICRQLKHVVYANKTARKMQDFIFFFWGGGGFATQDPKLEHITKEFKKKIKKEDKVIFITHGPPYGTELDKLEWAGHVGCKSQRKFLKEIKPILHICGHLHENINKQQIFEKHTVIINPGPAGTLIEI